MVAGPELDICGGGELLAFVEVERSQSARAAARPRDVLEPRPDEPTRLTPSLRPLDLLRLQRQAGNRAVVDLLTRPRTGRPVQRASELTAVEDVPSAIAVPGKGAVAVYSPDLKRSGKIVEAYIKKTINPTTEVADPQPHMKHWWILFKVQHKQDFSWMQVDLNLQDGYRIIWGYRKDERETLGYEELKVPTGVTTEDVETATQDLAREKVKYYNPQVPNTKAQRYSCQDFTRVLAERLGMS